jgi:tRNA threonylcarbamoyladenosine biosynthesis protein TsaE
MEANNEQGLLAAVEWQTSTPIETGQLASHLGALLQGGEVIALEGQLGAGKTHFVKGLAEGLGSHDHVTSPTFNLIHEYLGGRLPLYHFDVYRLDSPAELEGLGYEEYFYGQGVTAIEWSDIIKAYLPADYLHVEFKVSEDGQSRFIKLTPYGTVMVQLVKKLKQEAGQAPC